MQLSRPFRPQVCGVSIPRPLAWAEEFRAVGPRNRFKLRSMICWRLPRLSPFGVTERRGQRVRGGRLASLLQARRADNPSAQAIGLGQRHHMISGAPTGRDKSCMCLAAGSSRRDAPRQTGGTNSPETNGFSLALRRYCGARLNAYIGLGRQRPGHFQRRNETR
jgi:hypothetical protein